MTTVDALAAALHLHSIVDDGVDDHGERWFGCICGETLRGADRASELFGAHLAAALADAGYVVVRAEEPDDRLFRLEEAVQAWLSVDDQMRAGVVGGLFGMSEDEQSAYRAARSRVRIALDKGDTQ